MDLQLDSLYYTPDINLAAGGRSSSMVIWHPLSWAPRALLAAGLLRLQVKRWYQGKI